MMNHLPILPQVHQTITQSQVLLERVPHLRQVATAAAVVVAMTAEATTVLHYHLKKGHMAGKGNAEILQNSTLSVFDNIHIQ